MAYVTVGLLKIRSILVSYEASIKPDGSKSKNFFDIDDPKSIVKEQS